MVVEKVNADSAPSRSYNAETMEHVDMLQAGIIDRPQGDQDLAGDVRCDLTVEDVMAMRGTRRVTWQVTRCPPAEIEDADFHDAEAPATNEISNGKHTRVGPVPLAEQLEKSIKAAGGTVPPSTAQWDMSMVYSALARLGISLIRRRPCTRASPPPARTSGRCGW